jgi:AraC family transcriptional regulator
MSSTDLQFTALPLRADHHFMLALGGLLARAREVLDSDPQAAERCIEHATARMLAFRDSPRTAVAIPIPILAAGGLAPWQVSKVKLYVEAHLSDDITCPELAALVRLSASHFSRAFKVSFGCSPHAYVVAQRLDQAKALMLSTEAPLCEVALVCGFADQSHFSTKFHRAVGRTPSAWRRLNASSAPG